MLRYIDSVIDEDGNERLTVEGFDLYNGIERQMETDFQETFELAGLKPLPINRMVRQAGREANQFYTKGSYGKPFQNREGQTLRYRDGTPQGRQSRPNPNDPYYEKGDGRMPADMKQRLIERQQKTKEVIDDWDPIEASAQEDYNRLKGGNKPIVNPGALPLADELIQTIETPIAPATSQMDRYGI